MIGSVQSIAFGSGSVEISYVEEREEDRTTGIMEIRTIVVPNTFVEAELEELHSSIEELINLAGVARRNPPDKR